MTTSRRARVLVDALPAPATRTVVKRRAMPHAMQRAVIRVALAAVFAIRKTTRVADRGFLAELFSALMFLSALA